MWLSVDDVESGVFAQAFGNDYAVGGLVVLEHCGHDAGQGQGRAVEGVAQMGFLVVAAVTAFEAVGLVRLEVGYRRYLKPAFLCAGPYFEVECYGRGEAHVAAAQT